MADKTAEAVSSDALLEMTTKIVSSYVRRNKLSESEISDVIRSIYITLSSQKSGDAAVAQGPLTPAVPTKKSVMRDYIVCLEDGRRLKMLKRHLRTRYGLSPQEYRTKWGLPADYPMVAPNYAAKRSEFAKKIGLGRKPAAEPAEAKAATAKAASGKATAAGKSAKAPARAAPAKTRAAKPKAAAAKAKKK